MQKNYKLILSIIALIIASLGLGAFAQENVEYKDVILDGKPAKLNVATGEITLVNAVVKKEVDTPKAFSKLVKETVDTESTTDFHIVKEGENLLMIANSYNTTLAALKKANKLETTLVNNGQWLRVRNLHNAPVNAIPTPAYYPNSSNEENTSNTADTSSITDVHIVVSGNTLYSLAKLYNLSVNQLKNLNGLTSNLIKIGQRLKLVDNTSNVDVGHTTIWTVAKGDTLYNIAHRNNTTVSAIKSKNGLTSNLILVGQKLQLY